MLPDPLHPAIVHLPMALSVLVPAFALLSAILIGTGWLPVRAWALVALAQAILVATSWLAVETGEAEEERVEMVVDASRVHTHEESAEQFLAWSAAALVVYGAGLLPRRSGAVGRAVGVVAGLALLGLGYQVGHSGGDLVYEHGAARAYEGASEPGARAHAPGH